MGGGRHLDSLRNEQALAFEGARAALGHEPLIRHALVGSVLIDQIHAIRRLGDNICLADLADDP